MKHTKGKWYVEKGLSYFFVKSRHLGTTIMMVDEMKTYADYDEAEANANLVSKAPEMHEVLKELWESETYTLNEYARITVSVDFLIKLESLLKEIES